MNLSKKFLLGICLLAVASFAMARLTGSLAPDAINRRLAPIGQVNVIGAEAAQSSDHSGQELTPQQIYDDNCKMCHQTGLAGAPKYGNKADWDPRIAQGVDTLVKTAITGIRAMPPKGNCLSCTNDEIKATVEYMLQSVQ